jgi:hypothetical protein
MKTSFLSKSGIAIAVAIALAFAAPASAQNGSDMSGVGGGGSGLPGSLGVGLPAGPGSFTRVSIIDGVANQAAMFMNATTRGVSSSNPATGTNMTVPQNVAQALGAALSGNGQGAGALSTALTAGGISADQATALVQALTSLGSAPSLPALRAAVNAYNDAVNASTGAVPPALVAVRGALAGIIGG